MADERVSTTEQLMYAGAVAPATAVFVGIAAVLVWVAISFWEMRAASWRSMVPVLWVLRAVAVGVLLWMLTEPTVEIVTQRTSSQSVRVLVDTSGSMGVVDPLHDDPGSVRWAAASAPSAGTTRLVRLDQAATALALAERAVERYVQSTERGRPGRHRAGVLHRADGLVSEAVNLLDAVDRDATLESARALMQRSIAPVLARQASRGEDDVVVHAAVLALDELRQQLGWCVEQVRTAAAAEAQSQVRPPGLVETDRMSAQGGVSRIEQVAAVFGQAMDSWLAELMSKATVRVDGFAGQVLPLSMEHRSPWLRATTLDVGQATDLAQALEHAAQDVAGGRTQAVVLVTDGRHNHGAVDPLAAAASLGSVPVFIVPIGSTRRMRDVVLHHVQAPRSVFLGDLMIIEATIDAYECAGEELIVQLLDGEQVLDERRFEVGSNLFVQRVTFTRQAEALGRQTLGLRVQPVPDEQHAENNQATVDVEVVEDTLRVLLVDHRARWEYRYLQNLFRRDERVEHEELLLEPASRGGRAALPGDVDAWGAYRVVILGDLPTWSLSAREQDALAEYVAQRGGTLIVIGGGDSMPSAYRGQRLEALLPVREQRTGRLDSHGWAVTLAPLGRAEPAMHLGGDAASAAAVWEGLTQRLPIHDLSPYSVAKPTAHVLLQAEPVPGANGAGRERRAYLSWQRYGRGRVVFLASPSTHRLRFQQGDHYHYRFWGELLRWALARDVAGGSEVVRLTTDRTRYREGDMVEVSLRLIEPPDGVLRGAEPVVEARLGEQVVLQLDMAEDPAQPGTYRSRTEALSAGQYILRAGGDDVRRLLEREGFAGQIETSIAVEPDEQVELRNTRADMPLLRQLAEVSGGLLIPPTAIEVAMTQLDLAPSTTEERTHQPVWPRWACLWVFAGCLLSEWTLRKLIGLS